MTGPVTATGQAPAQHTDHAKAAREFEAVFAGQFAQLLMESVGVDPAFGGGHGEEMFRGILAEELGRSIAAGGSLGLAPAVIEVLQRMERDK